MKNSIKLIVVVFALTMTLESSAQIFGVKAGLNLSNMLIKNDEDTWSEDFKMKPGFHAGVTAEFPVTEIFSFETGVLLTTKGFKQSNEDSFMGETEKNELKLNLFYLDVPLTAKIAYDIGSAEVYCVFGPYAGLGLSGKSKMESSYAGETETGEEDITWGTAEDEADLKRLDFGLMLGAGIEISSVQVGVSYGLGLANISPYTEDGSKINNRVLGISVGYKFGPQ